MHNGKSKTLTFFLFLSSFSVGAQHADTLLQQFVPKGYTILDTVSGNLNLDEYADIIMILQKQNESEYIQDMDAPLKRPLLILTGHAGNSYKPAARNDNSVLCKQCGRMLEDPFRRVVIKNGYFTVEHYYGSRWINWTQYVTYRYNTTSTTWHLYKISSESYNPDYPDDVGVAIKTKKDFGNILFTKFNLYEYERAEGRYE